MSNFVESKFMRVGTAFAIALLQVVSAAICFSIGYDVDMQGISLGLLGLLVFGVADFFIFLLLDSGTDCKGAAKFFKNLLFYVLFAVEVLTALVLFIPYISSGDNILAELSKYGGVAGLAFHGVTTFSCIIKFFVYFKMADGKLFPQWAYQYVSIGSMVVGYLIAVALTAIGLTAQFVIQWVPFIVFLVGIVAIVIYCFKKGAIFCPRYSSTGGYKPLTNNVRPRTQTTQKTKVQNNSDSFRTRSTAAMNEIYDQLGKYCSSLSGSKYVGGSYLTNARVDYSVNFSSSQSDYIGKFYIRATYYLTNAGSHNYGAADRWAQDDVRTIRDLADRHREALEAILKRIVREKHPGFNGTCKIVFGYANKVSYEVKGH